MPPPPPANLDANFNVREEVGKKSLIRECKHCNYIGRHNGRQREHLRVCKGYLQLHGQQQIKIQTTLKPPTVTRARRNKLEAQSAMVIYADARPFNLTNPNP